jgi:hypothetical protein
MTLCQTCQHMATKTTPSPMIGLLFGCKELKITFGTETDWKAGKKQRTDCEDYKKKLY